MKLQKRKLVNRPRRLRKTEYVRRLVRENHLHIDDLIMPIFVTSGTGIKREIASMPGIFQWSIDCLDEEILRILDSGVNNIILFGVPEIKDEVGSDAISDNGIIQQVIRFIKTNYPKIFIISDVCMCEYTDHGHCGIVHENSVHNDTTLEYLSKQAISHARAGVDMVAPSGMMDGMVKAIRNALDEVEFEELPIMSYSVKYESSFYGPFRDAVDSSPQFGDRKSYQMDPANYRESVREAELDISEGADIIMIKPALSYLDIISKIKNITNIPVACYNVSGEYSMIKAASEKGWIDEKQMMMEILLSMKRAGADIIITYFAVEVAKLLRGNNVV